MSSPRNSSKRITYISRLLFLKFLDRIEFLSDKFRRTARTQLVGLLQHYQLGKIVKPNKSMISKKILFFSACLYLALAFAELEKLEHLSKCRSKTILCPCMNKNGLRLKVTAKTCLVDHLIGKKSVCKGEAIIAKCKRGEVVDFHLFDSQLY